MWSILIVFSFCYFFWLYRQEDKPVKKTPGKDVDISPLAALYFAGFWEDKDDAVH